MPKKAATLPARHEQKNDRKNERKAAKSEPAQPRTPFKPGTMLTLRTPLDAQISPDGRSVAFLVNEYASERPKPRPRLWLAPVEGGEARPVALATGEDRGEDACPRWSPDSKSIAFLSTRDQPHGEKKQLYIATLGNNGEPGEAHKVCNLPNGAESLAWSPDGRRIAFVALEGGEPGIDPIVLGSQPVGRHRRLWAVRPESDTPEPVTPPDVTIWEYAWSPQSDRLAVFFSAGPDETHYYLGQPGVVPAGGGAVRQLATLTRQAAALIWSPDGTRIGYISGEWSDRGIVGGDVYVITAEDGKPQNLTPGVHISPSWLRWLPDGATLLYAAWDGVTHQIGLLDEATGKMTPLQRDFVVGDFAWPRMSASADATRIAVTHSVSGEHHFDVFAGDLEGDHLTWRRLTRLNPIAEETIVTSPTERITYTGADGWEIQALFSAPTVPSEKGRPPLALLVHGGPSSAWIDSWTGGYLVQLLASAGYAVLRPNPRGSMGRGVAFADAVLGDMGGKDFEDLLAGVDEVARRGLADGERVAILGWSYGGFMVAWAVSQTTRFKAAMMGAGVSDYHSFHAQTNIPDWDMRFLTADPLENPEAYRARSAITFAKNVTTPTLILHGEKDLCVPVNQAYAFHAALRERNTPVELAVYPREGHGFQEREHVQDMEERILRWLKTYL
jgi:dipeptidyl aminopeptidase/acylaminoacyl peptidase